MAQDSFSPDAWTRARNRFLEDLTDEEQRVFSQASPEAILYDASATEKIHQATSTTRGFVMRLQPFVEAVEQYGAALDVYSNIYPLVMGPLWGSVRVVLHLARESWKYFEKLADMFNHISNLLPRLRVYEELFPGHENLVHSISMIYFDVLKFCLDAKAVFRRAKHSILKLVWKPFERQFGSHLDAFRRHQEEMNEDISLSHMIEAADSRALIRSNQRDVVKQRYDQERLRTFASLSSAVDYEAKHRRLRELRHEGTGTWLIKHPTYIAWKESMSSEGLFIYGIPGSGKSVLASLVVDDHLEGSISPARTALYFYCDYADPPTLQPVHVYRSLLQQLFLRGLMTEKIVESIIETLRVNIHGLSEQKLTNLLSTAIQSCAGLYIILDGLDECERDVQQAITITLSRLMTIGHPVIKFLVTCRDEGHLLTRFSNFNRLEISSQASAADIQSYISHAVTTSLLSGDLTLHNPALEEEIISKLVDKAQGMFLWVHFQIADLCDAVSDEGIREVLMHLPEGLYDTYTRIFKKIAKRESKAIVLKIMMWMVCARRLLRVEELQEAVAFDSNDKSWNADKIPNSDKMIKACHGLVVRDSENEDVRLAHHTVLQYLVPPQETPPNIKSGDFEELTKRAHFWPDLYKLRCNPEGAEVMAGKLCVTYLCFSDFKTAVSRTQDDKKFDLTATFQHRGPISIPAALGLDKRLHSVPYKFFGGHNSFKMPEVDYSKYLNVRTRDRRPSPDFRKKFALLEYVIEYWPSHTIGIEWSSEPRLAQKFWHLVQHETLAFEFRPWGPNRHFGPNGCKGCPVPNSNDLEPKDLRSMALVHWAAKTGYLMIFDIIEPRLQEYLEHERHHDETLFIACRHGQDAVVKSLLALRDFDLSDGRAIVAACASGSPSLLQRLLQLQDADRPWRNRQSLPPYFALGDVGPVVLYQAASNGHAKIVEILLAYNNRFYVSDTVTGLTPLQIAANNGHLQVVRALLSVPPEPLALGCDIDAPHEKTGMKALQYAAECGHDEIVSLLVKHDWGCKDSDSLDETALIKASKNGQATVVKSLLEAGADPLVRGGELGSMIERGSFNIDAIEMRYGKPTAVHHAASNGHDSVLAILPYSDLRCGAEKTNALHLGAAHGHLDVVEILLSKGFQIDLESASYRGYTALHYAAHYARTEIIRFLVARGAAVDAKTKSWGWEFTALHLAARRADADTIRTLVECGASLEELDKSGKTALDNAALAYRLENVLVLIELGAEWIRHQVFYYAIYTDGSSIIELLLSRLSRATAKQRERAVVIIKYVLGGKEGQMYKDRRAVTLFKHWLSRERRSDRVDLL